MEMTNNNFVEYLVFGGAMTIVFIIVALFIAHFIIKTLVEYINMCIQKIDDMNVSIKNVVDGSKRMERNVDAINQRTKAHLVNRKTQPETKKKEYSKGNRDGGKRSQTRKNYSTRDNSSK